MNQLFKEFHDEIETGIELSFTGSDGESLLASELEPEHTSHKGDDSPSSQYRETPLTDDAVTTMENWLGDNYLQSISNENIIAQLDEILLLLIAVRGRACGKELRQDLRRLFGADLSPGTVYPHLTDLADEGLLAMTELKMRKVYQITDCETTFNRIVPEVNRLLTLSLLLKALLIDCRSPDLEPPRGEADER